MCHHLLSIGLLGGLATLIGSCTVPLPPAQYKAYLIDPVHGLTQTTESNGITVTCSYRPTDLLVLQDLTSRPYATRDSLSRAYVGKIYCTLTFSRNGQELENQFLSQPAIRQRVIDYLRQNITADVFLVTSPHDSVAATASFYVQQFGLSRHSTVILVFSAPLTQQDFHLTLRGQALGVGYQRFTFTTRDLAALPPLRFE